MPRQSTLRSVPQHHLFDPHFEGNKTRTRVRLNTGGPAPHCSAEFRASTALPPPLLRRVLRAPPHRAARCGARRAPISDREGSSAHRTTHDPSEVHARHPHRPRNRCPRPAHAWVTRWPKSTHPRCADDHRCAFAQGSYPHTPLTSARDLSSRRPHHISKAVARSDPRRTPSVLRPPSSTPHSLHPHTPTSVITFLLRKPR